MSSSHDHRTVRPAALAAGLIMIALLLALVLLRQQPPAPKGAGAAPDEFSAGRAWALEQEILAEDIPHYVGSPQNDIVRERIAAAFEDLGYEVEVQETVACRSKSGAYSQCAPIKNIVTRLPGCEDGPAFMLVAHYDSERAAPGTADDGSSVVEILEIARILKEEGSHRNPVVFLITDAEETGLLGAQGFVDDHPWAGDVAVALNLEARGTRGLSFMFETSAGNTWLVKAYARSVPRPSSSSLHYEIYKILPNDTDLTVFRSAGMAGLNWAFIGRSSHYHTPLDNAQNLQLSSVQHQGDSVLAVARELAKMDLSSPPPGDAAWTDLMGFATIWWPASWTLPLAVLALLLLLVVAIWLIRRHGALSPSGLLLGLLAAFLTLVLTILLGLGLTLLISAIAGVPSPWYAYPVATRVAVWAGALLAGGLVGTLLARRAGAWGLALGAWLLWALLALLLSLAIAGVAILLLLPTFAAGLIYAAVAFTPLYEKPWAGEAALILASLVGAAIWLPLALAFESAVSFDLSPAITFSLGLVVSTLAPLWALPGDQPRMRRWLLIGSGAAVLLATVIAILLPPYSASDPQQVNLFHFEDVDRDEVYWMASSEQGPLPVALQTRLGAEPLPIFPWIGQPLHVVAAQSTASPPPGLEVVSVNDAGGGRTIEARLRSDRGGDWISLHVPAGTLLSVGVEGYDLPVNRDEAWNGYYTLDCHGRACHGLPVRLGFETTDPVEMLVIDRSSGLPAGGDAWTEARGPTAVPVSEGDLTIILKRVEL